jgi:uncharacterized protein (DUF1697 family)
VARYVVLLRGINLGSRNRIAMPKLRAAFEEAGFEDVQTHLQSGNVVVGKRVSAKAVERLIKERFGLEIDVVVRSGADLARIVKRNPLRKVATNPKRYQVTFLARKLPEKAVRELEEAAVPGERVVVEGREVYAWHAEGIARSKLWSKLAAKSLGITATSRNWSTVEALHELAAPSPNRHRSRTRA